MSDIFYKAPWPRGPVENLGPADRCIYCGKKPPEVDLTREHIIADGLGGDLVYLRASCTCCAKHTNKFESHVINSEFQFARGVVGVRSRKRKSRPLTARIEYADDGELADLPLANAAPFMLALPISDNLPGILTGAAPKDAQKSFQLGMFGQRDWNPVALKWVGRPAHYKTSYYGHMGVLGQVIAKTAHAYACAKLGPDAFTPFLTGYILANEPPFDAHLMGIHDSHDVGMSELHFLTINLASVPRWTVVGPVVERVYVVGMRFFANRPTPSFIAVVGRPIGAPALGVPAFGGLIPNPHTAGRTPARSQATRSRGRRLGPDAPS